jgi:hypothetical protein
MGGLEISHIVLVVFCIVLFVFLIYRVCPNYKSFFVVLFLFIILLYFFWNFNVFVKVNMFFCFCKRSFIELKWFYLPDAIRIWNKDIRDDYIGYINDFVNRMIEFKKDFWCDSLKMKFFIFYLLIVIFITFSLCINKVPFKNIRKLLYKFVICSCQFLFYLSKNYKLLFFTLVLMYILCIIFVFWFLFIL